MKLVSYQYSPLGYRSPLYQDDIKQGTEPDQMIIQSYMAVSADYDGRTLTWEFKRKAINRVMDRFGHLGDWLEAQENNERLSPHLRGLLEDTLLFIGTGVRPMSVANRVQCIRLEGVKKDRPGVVRGRHKRPLRSLLSVSAKDYMWHWLNQRNGFNDMLYTANVIFGDIDKDILAIK